LATAPEKSLKNGGYYKQKKLSSPSTLALDAQLGKALWDFSRQEVARIGSLDKRGENPEIL
jgi:hypothetical protein